MGVMAREQKLNISAPILGPFTLNPMYEVSLSSPKLKKRRGLKAWARSKPWRYWVFLAMIVVFLCLACASIIFALSYLMWQHRSPPPPNGATSPLNGTTPAIAMSYVYSGHSYLIDVEGGEDENTRAANRDVILEHLGRQNIKYTISRTISSPVFNGFRIDVEGPPSTGAMVSHEQLLNVWPVQLYSVPLTGNLNFPRERVVGRVKDSSNSDKTRRQEGFPFYPPHTMTGVDKLHDQGFIGTGVQVGIIDSGVDFTHPALGGCFGRGCKIAGGADLVGNQYNGNNESIPGPIPFDNCDGHGTHTTGILAADARKANASQPFTGVAPGATIYMYRVFGCKMVSSTDIIIDAMCRAFTDGAQVISMSLGRPNGWSEEAQNVVGQRIAARGVFLSVAVGDEGAEGVFDISTPSSGLGATAVASVDNSAVVFWNAVTGNGSRISYFKTNPFGATGPMPLYFTASTPEEISTDACSPLSNSTPDLSKFVVVTSRGNCSLISKIDHLVAKNATCILITNVSDLPLPDIDNLSRNASVALVGQNDGQILRANPNETVTFPEVVTGQFTPNAVTGGSISFFSSWGPSSELKIKPNIAAPGGYIYSTFPLAQGAYLTKSGTSMATPYLSGIAALWLSAKGQIDPLKLRDLMSITASPLGFNNDRTTLDGVLAPVIQQGAGFINATKLFSVTTILSPAFIELNDTEHFAGVQVISVTNNGTGTVSYSFGSINAATAYGLNQTNGQISFFPPQLDNTTPVSVTISPNTIDLEPGKSTNVTATFTLNTSFDTSKIPLYSGWLIVNSSAPGDGGTLRIPFMGAATNMSSLPLYDTSKRFPSLTTFATAPNNSIMVDGVVFTLANDSSTPCINVFLLFGPRTLRMDVLPGEGNTAPTKDFAGLGIIGNFFEDQRGFGRNVQGEPHNEFDKFPWNGTLVDGSSVPDGSYRLGLRGLKLFATNESDPNNWDTYVSPSFIIRR